MKHKSNVDGFESLEKLATEIGDLKYDSLSEFLMLLSEKIKSDSKSDLERGRTKLSDSLISASDCLWESSIHIGESWRISKKFM